MSMTYLLTLTEKGLITWRSSIDRCISSAEKRDRVRCNVARSAHPLERGGGGGGVAVRVARISCIISHGNASHRHNVEINNVIFIYIRTSVTNKFQYCQIIYIFLNQQKIGLEIRYIYILTHTYI